jgi:hypothetical protein
MPNNQLIQKTCTGLSVGIDENNKQHLIWNYNAMGKGEEGFDKSAIAGIDAHNGEIVWQALIT